MRVSPARAGVGGARLEKRAPFPEFSAHARVQPPRSPPRFELRRRAREAVLIRFDESRGPSVERLHAARTAALAVHGCMQARGPTRAIDSDEENRKLYGTRAFRIAN
jgi:hypothetical protein